MGEIKTYSLVNYFDVWGNCEDGWEINNLCTEFDDLVILEDASDQDILDYLKDIGFIKNTDINNYEIEDLGDNIEFNERDTGRPLFALRLNNL